MTIPLSSLRESAFWDRIVCLSCGAVQPDDTDPEEHNCLFCSSEEVVSASAALTIFLLIDDDSAE